MQILSHRYRMLQLLGEGGLGKVYKAYDQWTQREVALKVLTGDGENPSFLQRFQREFLLLYQLKHPGVVKVLDFGYSEDALQKGKPLPYFSMELVEGKTLGQAFANLFDSDKSSYQFEQLYRLIWQICDILEFIHLRGIVHCDLKPENLKITDQTFRSKILDFGLAEMIGSRRGKETKGTLLYMAPEMFSGKSLDGRTDLYSLGIILYELVTSSPPFSSDDPVKIVSAHLQQKPVPPLELNPNLPCSLNELILKLLKKSPADRPNSATQVKKMIEEGLKEDFRKPITFASFSQMTRLAHIYSGEMAGRETELVQLEDDLQEVLSSGIRCLFLSGEQGVGKTFLLDQLKIKAQFQRIIFVDSHCVENQTSAYQPLMEILHKLRPYVESRCADPLVKRFREISRWWGKDPSPAFGDQSLLHQKIKDLLIQISCVFPFVMVIENLQWSDSSTLRFLDSFQRENNEGKIYLCCSLRDEKFKRDAGLVKAIKDWIKLKKARHLRINRFDLPRTSALISSKFKDHRFPPSFFAYLHKRTSGNPFFIIEVLKYLLEKEIIFLRDSSWMVDMEKLKKAEVPDSMETILLKNLQRYDKETLAFLNVLSVIGKKMTLKLLKELNLFEEKTLLRFLSSLTNDQILQKDEEADELKSNYEFANQSLQELLYQRLDEQKRIFWHKRVGEILERISSKEEEEFIFDLAFHYREGKDFDKAYQYALLSAERMQKRFANQEVIRYLQEAINGASKLSDPEDAIQKKVEALMKRADFCKRVGELDQAEADYLAILRQIKGSSDLKLQVKTYNGLGETYRLKHDYKKGLLYLKEAMKIHHKLGDPAQLADTLSYLGLLYLINSQYPQALDSFRRALEVDRRLGNKSAIASTLNNMGMVFWSQHQYPEALKYFTDALSAYRELDNSEWIARCLNNVGATLFELGEYVRCIDYFQESFELNQKINNQKENVLNLENLGETHQKMGEYTKAMTFNKRGLSLAKRIGLVERAGYILKNMGMIHLESGEYHQAYTYLQEALKTAEKIEDKELQILVWLSLSEFYLLLNDLSRGEKLLDEATRIIDMVNDERFLIRALQLKSGFRRKEGKLEEAERLLDQAQTLAQKLNAGEELFALQLDYSDLHLEQKDLKRSEMFLEEAKKFGLLRYVLYQPAFYLISGRAKWMRGDLKSAQKDFETALNLAEKQNSSERIWQIHHYLGKLFLSLRDLERAYQELKNAGKILKELSEKIKDEDLKRNYLKDPRKKEFLSDLEEVAKKLCGEIQVA